MPRSLIPVIIAILLIACSSVALPLQATITPSPSMPPFAATLQALTHDAQVQFGPENQTVDLNMRTFSGHATGESFTDFVAEMRCYNPYGQSGTDKWAYGFVFRYTSTDGFYKVVVNSDANWSFIQEAGTETNQGEPYIVLGDGTVSNFKVGPDEYNDLQLIVFGTDAVFIVNGQYVAMINGLSQVTKGDTAPAFLGKEGAIGRCINFMVKTFSNQ